MPDVNLSTLNLVFAVLSVSCALLSVVMFVLARRAAREDRLAVEARALRSDVREPPSAFRIVGTAADDGTAADSAAGDLLTEVEPDDADIDAEIDAEIDDRVEAGSGGAPKLPRGAEAALWAITETVPDPRNHLVLKDPTSEVRIPAALAEAPAAPASRSDDLGGPAERPAPRPADEGAAGGSDRADHGGAEDGAEPRVMADAGATGGRVRGAIDDTDVFTGEYFFAGEPRLNQF